MSNRIDLDQLEEELANLQDMHFDTRLDERVANANMFNRMLNELARCYKLLDDADYVMSRYGGEEEHQDIDNVCDAYEALCLALDGRGRYC